MSELEKVEMEMFQNVIDWLIIELIKRKKISIQHVQQNKGSMRLKLQQWSNNSK
jgi:hypothetical protein